MMSDTPLNDKTGTTAQRAEVPDCAGCVHYYITHEAHYPFGCRKFGFKSGRKPSLEVWEASHQACLGFTPRR
jgi:hypothetical protein